VYTQFALFFRAYLDVEFKSENDVFFDLIKHFLNRTGDPVCNSAMVLKKCEIIGEKNNIFY